MGAGGDVLLYQLSHGLPFYSQILYQRHENNASKAGVANAPEGRTLFLKSLDCFLNESTIASGFKRYGEVQLNAFSRSTPCDSVNPSNPVMYHAVFSDAKSLNKFYTKKEKQSRIIFPAKSDKSHKDPSFLSRALEHHRHSYRGTDILQKNADECMVEYDLRKDIEKKLAKDAIVDDEGFTLVTTGNKATVDHRPRGKRKRESDITATSFYRFPNKDSFVDEP